jgi:hypothetical protein
MDYDPEACTQYKEINKIFNQVATVAENSEEELSIH